MKRFALKRITALVLALVMALSLLPMTVWAEETGDGEQPLYFGDGPDDNLTYNSEFRADVNKQYTMRFFIDKNGTRVTNDGGYELSTEGNIGTFTANDWDCTWDTTNATDAEGYLKVKKENITYAMKVTVNLNPGGNQGNNQGGNNGPVVDGVTVYSDGGADFLGYSFPADYDGISVNGRTVYIPSRPVQQKSVCLVTDKTLSLSNAEGSSVTLESFQCSRVPENMTAYRLTVPGQRGGPSRQVKVNVEGSTESITFEFIFDGVYFSGVKFYTDIDENGHFKFKDWNTCDGLRTKREVIKNESDEEVEHFYLGVPFTVGQEKVLYLVPNNSNAVLSLGNGWLKDHVRLEGIGDTTGAYKLTLASAAESGGNIWINSSAGMGFDIIFEQSGSSNQGGDQGGGEDTTYWKTYNTKYAGNSTFTVRRTELQAQVLTLPDEINENNELIITVHNAAENNEAVWRELVQRDELMVSYFFDSIEDEGVAKPMVKSTGTDGSIADAIAWLAEFPYVGYDFPSGRFNGVNFAWATTESDRTVVIPTENMMVSSWIWGYDNGNGIDTEKPDGVIVKLVLDDDISNAIVLEEEKHPAVETERVSLIGHDGLDAGDGKIFSGTYSEATGVYTYEYIGTVPTEGFASAAINTDVLEKIGQYRPEQTDEPIYQLLKVTAPTGYTAKYFSSRFFEGSVEGNEIILEYLWRGLGTEQTYTLVWCKGEGESYREYVEQITVAVPTVAGVETWMDHINGSKSEYTNCATAVADANVLIKQAGKAESGAEISYSNGVVWTDFVQGEMLNVEAIEEATISIKIPDGAVAYKLARPGDGADDPTYNENNKWAPDDFQSILEACEYVALIGNEEYIDGLSVNALKEQNIGDIQYYYSADRGTWLILIKWIFDSENEDNGAKYEWIRLDAENYFCQWEEELMKDSEVTDEVDVPTATTDGLADSDIKLIARIHPQKQEEGYGQYFFELEMVAEGQGNVYTDTEGTTYFTIILPYSFMGDDWSYEKAKNLKEKPMITHFDKEFKKLAKEGEITGEYTERGIEFKVNSFSPFTVSWDETVKDNTGGTPGGYYPVVTPTTPVEKPTEPKPTTPAQPTTPPAEVTVPVSGEENTINVEASVSGSTATIDKVDMTKLEGVIGDDVAVGTVTIDFSDLKSSETIDTVEIPADVVKEIAEAVADPNNDAESLEIVLSDGASIEFDAAALAEKVSQAGGADITISIKHAVENILSAAQQASVGDRVAFDINVTSGGVHISDMGGKITIHAPYELRDGETAEGIVVYYVDDEGNKEKCETSYDSVKKRVNWKTDHLSVYMIAHEAPATDDAPAVDNAPADDATQNDSGNSVGLWIGVMLVVLVAAIVVVVILIKRKKA